MHVRHAILAVLLVGFWSASQANSPLVDGAASDSVSDQLDPEAVEGKDDGDDYEARRLALFDRLSNDPSPRQQVLAGQIYLDEDDSALALRPKRKDVVARAVQLAPDDAFVQYLGAMRGSYSSSQCGSTSYPDAEVANLIRLEPDNAAAWQFAVALAQARGDHAGVDEALSRMAGATRADDHFVEHIAEWRKAYAGLSAGHPFLVTMWAQASDADRTLLSAFMEIGSGGSSAAWVLKSACTADAGERTWPRLGWCADAAHVLAAKGGSLVLREQGLELLDALGDRSAETAALQKQADWFAAHDASPLSSTAAESKPSEVLSDWAGAKSQVDAIEHKLRRTGQPLQVPPAWSKPVPLERGHDANQEAAQKAFRDYLVSLVDWMSVSSDERMQAAATLAQPMIAAFGGDEAAPAARASLSEFARSHPDSALVQWLAANPGNDADVAAAIAQLQHADADNAAAWWPALTRSINDDDATSAVLEQMASRTRFDDHLVELAGVWRDAINAHPPSPETLGIVASIETNSNVTAENVASSIAPSMAATSMPAFQSIFTACASTHTQSTARRSHCVQIAHVMLMSGTSAIAARIGEGVLRRLDGMTPDDTYRARQIAWWSSVMNGVLAKDHQRMVEFIQDQLAAGSEVEALRLGAQRLGNSEPSDTWRSPTEQKAVATPVKPAG